MAASSRLTAVYPGTFDPMTLGHQDLIARASRLFGRLIVAVAAGHHKRTMFTIAERLEIARELAAPHASVEVIAFRGLLRDFVVGHGGKGSHRNFKHPKGVRITISGKLGGDAKPYQEKAVKQALRQVSE